MSKVLFVDDQVNILKALRRTVEDEPIEIFTAESGKEGLELMKEHEFDVIFSDVRMPEMDGIEFLSKSREVAPNSVRIVLSAFADREQVLNAVNKGFIWNYQVKPWEDEDLILTLRNAKSFFDQQLENSRLAEELQKSYQQLEDFNNELEIRVWERTKELVMREEALKMLLDNKGMDAIREKIQNDLQTLTDTTDVSLSLTPLTDDSYEVIELWRQSVCQGYVAVKNFEGNAKDKIQGYLPIVEMFMTMWKVMAKKESIMGNIDVLLKSLED